jgi:hypothetical protein
MISPSVWCSLEDKAPPGAVTFFNAERVRGLAADR